MSVLKPYDLLCITTAERNLIADIIDNLTSAAEGLRGEQIRFISQEDVKCTFERLLFLSGRLDQAVNTIWSAKEKGDLLEQA